MMESFFEHAYGFEATVTVEVDDSEHELGFCGAVREGWARLRSIADEREFDYVWHAEEDFEYLAPIPIHRMANLLDDHPRLAQVALRRGPANDREREAGGVIELVQHTVHEEWIEHQSFYTTNPHLARRSLIEQHDWPEAPECEGRFGYALMHAGFSSAYWGPPGEDGIMVKHTGITRTGTGY